MNVQRNFWRLAVSVILLLSGAAFFTPRFADINTFAETEKERRPGVDDQGIYTLAVLDSKSFSASFWHALETFARDGEGSRTHAAGGMRSSTEIGRSLALEVWQRYTQCEKTREFRPCFTLLSKDTLRIWEERGVKTADEYRDDKGSGEVWFTDFKVLNVGRSDGKIVITARARGGGERGAFEVQREYILVPENGDWKLEMIREGTVRYLP